MCRQSILLGIILLISPPLFAKPSKADGMPPVIVETMQVQEADWQEQVQATGILMADQAVMLKPEISGKITKIFFRSGQAITKGAALLQLNADTAKAQLDYALAQSHLSTAEYKRAVSLCEQGALSKSDLDKVTANYKTDLANAAKAQAEYSKTLIRAPFSGRLGLRLVDVGDYITAGQNVVEIQGQDKLRVDFSIPETYLSRLAVGQNILLQINGYSQQNYKGKVYAFAAAVDSATHTLAMRATVPNSQHKLIPGSLASVTLLLDQSHKVLAVPQIALINSEEGNYVYRVIKQQAVKTSVITGDQYQDKIVIQQGLNKVDVIVTAGQLKLRDGAAVITR